MAIYKAVLNGSYLGQAINNILYYRTGIGIDVLGFAIGGAGTLGECIKDQVWPKMKECLPANYKLEAINVYPYEDGTFDLMYQNPASVNVLESGNRPNGTDGSAPCAIIKFNLEATTIVGNGPKPPKRGYVAIGPLVSAYIDDAGYITESNFLQPTDEFNVLAAQLASNLESLLPPVIFFPIRVKTDKVLNIFHIVSYADVGGATLRRKTSFRRSRMAE